MNFQVKSFRRPFNWYTVTQVIHQQSRCCRLWISWKTWSKLNTSINHHTVNNGDTSCRKKVKKKQSKIGLNVVWNDKKNNHNKESFTVTYQSIGSGHRQRSEIIASETIRHIHATQDIRRCVRLLLLFYLLFFIKYIYL